MSRSSKVNRGLRNANGRRISASSQSQFRQLGGAQKGKKVYYIRVLCDQDQPPEPIREQGKPRDYKLKCGVDQPAERFRELRKIRLWQQWQDHGRWIESFILVDQSRTLFVTLTFYRFVTLMRAKAVAKRVVRWLMNGVIESWVKVLERGGGGVHIHLVMRLKGTLSAETGLRMVGVTIRRHNQRAKLIGRWEAKPVWDAAGMSEYLVKTLDPDNEAGRAGRVKGRGITYARSVQRQPWWRAQEETAA